MLAIFVTLTAISASSLD